MSVFSTFFYYAFMQQDLIFSENLSSVILCLNLLWTEDALNNTIFVDDESSTESTHVGTAIHLLLTINTECLNEFQVSIGNDWERKFILFNKLLV